MSRPTEPADVAQRLRALEPTGSFIVQAPAGSGKTSLLTQRFLVLLAGADAPEEVVAITFTRKAAAEMRQRVLETLDFAATNARPEEGHEKLNWDLARKALERDKQKAWDLLDNPSRLRIQTIDSLCAMLAGQMPILSGLGAVPRVTEDARPIYLTAAANAIAEIESGAGWSEAVAHLVRHLDNRLDRLRDLIAIMLQRRDQWLRHVADPEAMRLDREQLEGATARLVEEALNEAAALVPERCGAELPELARFAAANLRDSASPMTACEDLVAMPGTTLAERPVWDTLATLLLTADKKSWRRQVDRRQGFPAADRSLPAEDRSRYADMKKRMTELLESLAGAEAFQQALAALGTLPDHRYSDAEWETLKALISFLRIASAHLEVAFRTHGEIDFTALSRSAIQALGEPEAPTDLALAFDHRIRHLLVDEFQDTSLAQHELLTRLTAGWQANDGHTLFLVGDPMQSIYRFREAEVGLFLACRENGLGQIPLESLKLSVNFRSQRGIVDWINVHFPRVLPTEDNIEDGAISFAASDAWHEDTASPAVAIHPALENDPHREAQEVVAVIETARKEKPDGTIAILVRSRGHLVEILTCLRHADLRYRAQEIESLARRPVVGDLLALTRALHHFGDRIAWLSILRAPFCGLTLADLHALAAGDPERPVMELLHDDAILSRLSLDGRDRIARVLPWIEAAATETGRVGLRRRIEAAWLAMGGPACVGDETELEDAEVFFQLLEALDEAGELSDPDRLEVHVEKLFALPDVHAGEQLQVMTMHKSKGLEFDTVILPGLGRKPRQEDTPLLSWLERTHARAEPDLLLAPISPAGEKPGRMTTLLRRIEQRKRRLEDARLLYVAVTRAKHRLHLFGHVDCGDDHSTLSSPGSDTLLARLWPVVESNFLAGAAHSNDESLSEAARDPETGSRPGRERLAADWRLPSPCPGVHAVVARAEPT
ncbi:MAG: AAA family ATPase, partial [Gammaproteobacteria bacterium]|nr:AAA family ATPase [Gammaproteobacteria bacterium]